MKELSYTLVCDGSSDKALLPIIDWAIGEINPNIIPQGVYAELGRLRHPPKNLTERIEKANGLYPSDIIIIHRDAEKEAIQTREDEIIEAVRSLSPQPLFVAIIPVRMTEAWLFVDEMAIRKAAGNRKSRESLPIPPLQKREKIDAKMVLEDCLRKASGLTGRRLQKFRTREAIQLIPGSIQDFTPLRKTPSFQHFYESLDRVLSSWNTKDES